MRRPMCLGNWKMHLTAQAAESLAVAIRQGAQRAPHIDWGVAPGTLSLAHVARTLSGSQVQTVAQACHWAPQGAYTGAVSCEQARDAGARAVLVGHSERRTLFAETLADTEHMVAAAERTLLLSIVCVGETLQERQTGKTLDVIAEQLLAACAQLTAPERLVVAYEPVWAIGTHTSASPQEAGETHALLRQTLLGRFGETGRSVRLLYGGSVTPERASGLAEVPEIDGFLVGGASLQAQAFTEIGAILGATKGL